MSGCTPNTVALNRNAARSATAPTADDTTSVLEHPTGFPRFSANSSRTSALESVTIPGLSTLRPAASSRLSGTNRSVITAHASPTGTFTR